MIGPCYRCAGWGHLAASCPKSKASYPLSQPVVSLADQIVEHHNVCGANVDSIADTCSAVQYEICKGVDSSPNKYTKLKGKDIRGVNVCKVNDSNPEVFGINPESITVKSVNACKANESNPKEFDVDPESIMCTGNGDYEYVQYGIDTTSKYWELESVETQQIVNVQGRLKQKLVFWKEVLHAPPPILDCIEFGYRLPLRFLLPPNVQSNHGSALEHCEFVNEAVSNLVTNHCAIKVSEKPHLCSPLLVVKNSSGN